MPGSEDERGLAVAREAGVHRIEVPTPFPVGPVNVYLIEDDPLVLIDTGPDSATALLALQAGLAKEGYSLEDIGLILLTHEHVDHIGLTAIVAQRSGAEVGAIGGLADFLEDLPGAAGRGRAFVRSLLLHHGVPDEVVDALEVGARASAGWGGLSVPVDMRLEAGVDLELRDHSLEILHRPGHTADDTVFVDRASRVTISGDHLLKDISSNALGWASGDSMAGTSGRVRSLRIYMDSLKATRSAEASVILGGHGESFMDHRSLIDQRLALTARRADKVLALIEPGESVTAYDLARRYFGGVANVEVRLTVSEMLGHLDLLVYEERATESQEDGIARFRAEAV